MGSDPRGIGPIKTEDYATALAEIDRLMGSPHGSRDGETSMPWSPWSRRTRPSIGRLGPDTMEPEANS